VFFGDCVSPRHFDFTCGRENEFNGCGETVSGAVLTEDGEAAFRSYETEVLRELGKQSQLIIATGGGCVMLQRNYPLLHQNSSVLWLDRDLSLLPTDGRPLSQSTHLTDMFAIRKPLYEAFADHHIDNNGSIDETIRQILTVLEVCL